MKKVIMITIVAALALTMTACSGKAEKNTTSHKGRVYTYSNDMTGADDAKKAYEIGTFERGDTFIYHHSDGRYVWESTGRIIEGR